MQCFQQLVKWLCAFESEYSGFYTVKFLVRFYKKKAHAKRFLAFYLKTQAVLPLLFFSCFLLLAFTTEIFSSTETIITEVWVESPLTFFIG